MNTLINKLNQLLFNGEFNYAICGGYAIDMFLGYESRLHGDVDIQVFWEDRDKIISYMQNLGFEVYEMIGNGKAHHIINVSTQMQLKRNIFCVKDGCDLVQLSETSEENIYQIDFDHKGQTEINFVEFLFNKIEDGKILYARNNKIVLSLDEAILFKSGIPYLSPEICLLYKSTDSERIENMMDFNNVVGLLSPKQKDWLKEAFQLEYGENHNWRV